MKNSIYCYYMPALIITLLMSCNNGPADPVKTAKKENEERIDSQITREQPIDSMAMQVSKKEADFMVNAASGGMLEVQLGELAQTNAKNPRVKSFGAMMMKDHKDMGDKLKALATSRNITLPDSVSKSQQKEKERLQRMKGVAFDETYINLMVDDHRKDIREFEQEAANGINEAVKAFASDNLATLRVHSDSAASIQRAVPRTKPSIPVVP